MWDVAQGFNSIETGVLLCYTSARTIVLLPCQFKGVKFGNSSQR